MTKNRKPIKMTDKRTKPKPLHFGRCHVCNKVCGYGMTMLDAHNSRVTICKGHHNLGCEQCGKPFTVGNPATEYIIFGPDGDPSEAVVRCAKCAERPDGP